MLDEFIVRNRPAILAQTRERVAVRPGVQPTAEALEHGVSTFLDQLGGALRRRRETPLPYHPEIGVTAAEKGHELQRMGFTIGQVVHNYGDICQAVTELALEQDSHMLPEEFQTLNLCLDDAIAAAVTEFAEAEERALVAEGRERLAVLSYEVRNLLNTALLSFEMIKSGRVSPTGSTSRVLERSLTGLDGLIGRSLAEVRLEAGLDRKERIAVASILEEIEVAATLQASARQVHLTVHAVEPAVIIEVDRQILTAAISNLLQNAFKFTRAGGHVSLSVRVTPERVLIDVEDECGGLPPGKAEELFRPFEQRSADRSGLGMGLSICLQAAKASDGDLRVRDLPGKGCVFTLDLPRKPAPPLKLVEGAKEAEPAPESGDVRARGK